MGKSTSRMPETMKTRQEVVLKGMLRCGKAKMEVAKSL